jgi:hypothetical protein
LPVKHQLEPRHSSRWGSSTMRHPLWLLPLRMNLLILPICAALLLLTAPAWADLSRDDAAAAAQRASNGRVLSVEKAESARGPVWRVKVVTTKGEVRVILIDAVSGKMLDR